MGLPTGTSLSSAGSQRSQLMYSWCSWWWTVFTGVWLTISFGYCQCDIRLPGWQFCLSIHYCHLWWRAGPNQRWGGALGYFHSTICWIAWWPLSHVSLGVAWWNQGPLCKNGHLEQAEGVGDSWVWTCGFCFASIQHMMVCMHVWGHSACLASSRNPITC